MKLFTDITSFDLLECHVKIFQTVNANFNPISCKIE